MQAKQSWQWNRARTHVLYIGSIWKQTDVKAVTVSLPEDVSEWWHVAVRTCTQNMANWKSLRIQETFITLGKTRRVWNTNAPGCNNVQNGYFSYTKTTNYCHVHIRFHFLSMRVYANYEFFISHGFKSLIFSMKSHTERLNKTHDIFEFHIDIRTAHRIPVLYI